MCPRDTRQKAVPEVSEALRCLRGLSLLISGLRYSCGPGRRVNVAILLTYLSGDKAISESDPISMQPVPLLGTLSARPPDSFSRRTV